MTIHSLENTSLEQIHTAFLDAFSNYHIPFQISKDALAYMLKRRGYTPHLSFGAFEGDKVLSFIFNGVRTWENKKTAYDTGTGTIPSYQGQGIAKQLFAHTVQELKAHDVEQYLLEVLKNNENAIRLYQKSGFQVSRQYNFFNFSKETILKAKPSLPNEFFIQPIENFDWTLFQPLWDFKPSWQNSIDSLETVREHLQCFAAFKGEELIGYLFFEGHTGDIPQLAVAKDYRKKGIASALLQTAARHHEGEKMKIINTDLEDDVFTLFMKNWGIEAGVGQYEMRMELS